MRYDTPQDHRIDPDTERYGDGRPRAGAGPDADTEPLDDAEPHDSDAGPAYRSAGPDVPTEPVGTEPVTGGAHDGPAGPTAVGRAATPPAAPAEPTVALWPPEAVHSFQERWREVQLRFVDDPRAAADEADALVIEALDRLAATVASYKRELDSWRGTEGADTEQMRMVVRRYRVVLDRLLGL
jgi:hypothetical protein